MNCQFFTFDKKYIDDSCYWVNYKSNQIKPQFHMYQYSLVQKFKIIIDFHKWTNFITFNQFIMCLKVCHDIVLWLLTIPSF